MNRCAGRHALCKIPTQRCLHPRNALVRHALQQADVEAEPASKQMVVVSNKFNLGNDSIQLEGERLLVPLDGGAPNSHKGKGDGRLPLLGAFEDQAVEGLLAARRKNKRERRVERSTGLLGAGRAAYILVFLP